MKKLLTIIPAMFLIGCNSSSLTNPEIIMKDVYEDLSTYSLYAPSLTLDTFAFSSPSELAYSLPDTLKGYHYTYYIEPYQLKAYESSLDITDDTARVFGFRLAESNDTLYLDDVFSGSAAETAGLLKGDRILAVDGYDVYGKSEIFTALTKDDTKQYSVIYKRDSVVDTIAMTKTVDLYPVSYASMINDDIGYIYLSTFMADAEHPDGSASSQFQAGLSATATAKITILDLRGNGGGYVSEAEKICDLLLPKGDTILIQKYYSSSAQMYGYEPLLVEDSLTTYSNRKFVLLFDEGSASASEMLISAISHNLGAKSVGKNSYGKAIAQGGFSYPTYGSAMHVTFLGYQTPTGGTYASVGFAPHYSVDAGYDNFEDLQLKRAVEIAQTEAGLRAVVDEESSGTIASIANFVSANPYKGLPVLEFPEVIEK